MPTKKRNPSWDYPNLGVLGKYWDSLTPEEQFEEATFLPEVEQHQPQPVTNLKVLESFADCAVCDRMVTRIGANGKVGKWRHL